MKLYKTLKKFAKEQGWKLKKIKTSQSSDVGDLTGMPKTEPSDTSTKPVISLMVNPEDLSVSLTSDTNIDESLCAAKLEEVGETGSGYIVCNYKDWLKWRSHGNRDNFCIRIVNKDYSSKVYRVLQILTHY